ncbi:FAS1 domain-containing protein [Chytriomyces cf. hyalinus JEL632]|nr:FAS1 domain-containing protein [Chytriomyces cf. hyalinus JEL632]
MNSILSISLLLLLLSVCSAQPLVEVLRQNSATTLLQLAKTDSQLFKSLSTFKGTVFAPTNDAFSAALKDGDRFTQDSTTDRVLKYHLVPDTMFAGDAAFEGAEFLVSLNGSDVKVSRSENGIVVSSAWNAPQANVVKMFAFTGGVVHFIDQTLTPPLGIVEVAKAAGLTSLVSAVVQAGLARTIINLKDATVFAPSNEAIAQISSLVNTLSKEQLAQVLLLHVVPNQRLHSTDFATSALLTSSTEARVQVQKDAQGVAVSGPGNDVAARVVTADVLASVGIVMHVVDKVLLPAGMLGGMEPASEPSADVTAMKGTLRVGKLAAAVEGEGGASLIAVLKANKATTLLSLVQSDKPILNALADFKGTLFAPTDKALAASVATGFNPKNLTLLSTVLKYHAIPTTVFAEKSFTGIQFLKSLEGDEVKASGSSAKGITITSAFNANTANVVSSMAFSGGIVHFIDATLTPPTDIVTVAKQAKLTALLNAIMSAGLVDTIVNLKTATVFAPSDQAFAAISATAAKLSKEQLKQVLLMHVVPGKLVHSTEAAEAKNLPSVGTAASGQMISVQSDGKTVLVKGGGNMNPSKVIVADVVVMGPLVVHVIDQVLLPGNLSAGAGSIAVGLNVAFWMGLFFL